MNKSSYIKGFDSLRAISILMVVVTHLGTYRYFEGNDFLMNRVWSLFSGLTGVQIFFTISGFLITRILLQEKIKNGKINFSHFYIRRFIRLLPALFIFYTLFLVFCLLKLIPFDRIGILFAVTYLYNFIPNVYYSGILGHMWSLGVEEQFYLLWPFIISMFFSFRPYLFLVIGFTLLCLYAVYWLPFTSFNHHGKEYLMGNTFDTERWFIPAALPILLGSLTSVVFIYKEEMIRKSIAKPHVMIVVATILFLSPLYLPESILSFKFFFQSIGVSFFLLLICIFSESSGVAILHRQPFIYIGKISYGIYVFQGIFLMTGPGGQLQIQQFPLNIFLTFLTAIFSYELIEKRCLRFKNKFSVQ